MQAFIDVLLPISIGVIMFGIGTGLSISDFKRVFIRPKEVTFGLIGQLLLLPLVGFLIAIIFPLDPVHQLGVILIAACPGGTSSNLVSYMLKGKVSLSVSITAFNSFLVVFTIPIILELAFIFFWDEPREVQMSMYDTFSEIIFTVLLPVMGGVALRHYMPKTASSLKKPLRWVLPLILFTVFLLILINNRESDNVSLLDYWYLLFPALFLNVFVMFVGFYLSGAIGIKHRGKYTIAIEMGLQNSALAIYLANMLQIDGLELIAVLYGSFSFFTTFIIAWFMKNYMNKKSI